MFWARTFVPVRQHQGEASCLPPLRHATGNELVNDDLGAVGEVAELGLPKHQGLWSLLRVAVLEGEGCSFRQWRVVDFDRSLRLGQVSDWCEVGARLRIVKDHVAVAECAALSILAGKTDWGSFVKEAAEGEGLSCAPRDPTFLHFRYALLKLLGELLVDCEAFRNLHQLLSKSDEVLLGYRRLNLR